MQGESLALKLARYLFCYRITTHFTTGLSPAELLMGHCPRPVLNLVLDQSSSESEESSTEATGLASCPSSPAIPSVR